MLLLNYFFKRILLFIFYFDLGLTYFFKMTLYRTSIKFLIYLLTKNKLVKLYHNLNLVDKIRWSSFLGLPTFLIYYFIELLNNIYIFCNKHKINFLIKLKEGILKAPALEIYYPLKTSIFSVTLRITGVFITLGLGYYSLILF
jgi:hypothetical protein